MSFCIYLYNFFISSNQHCSCMVHNSSKSFVNYVLSVTISSIPLIKATSPLISSTVLSFYSATNLRTIGFRYIPYQNASYLLGCFPHRVKSLVEYLLQQSSGFLYPAVFGASCLLALREVSNFARFVEVLKVSLHGRHLGSVGFHQLHAVRVHPSHRLVTLHSASCNPENYCIR